MREIKFRQPLFHNSKKFSEFRYWGFDKHGIFTAPCGNLNELEKETGSNQFTGLKDKNGVDIYEGDIVKVIEPNDDSCMGDEFEYIGQVMFGGNNRFVSDYKASFIIHVKEWYKEEGLLGNIRHLYEVIGNVYQTPELLTPLT